MILPLVLAAAAATTAAPAPGYVGSARCGSCHKLQHERWRDDWHARALSPPSASTVVGRFDPPAVFSAGGTRAEAHRAAGEWRMKAEDRSGEQRDFPVTWAVGGRRMQDYLTLFPDGRLQVLPIYFHVTGRGEWVDYTTVKQGALTREHPFFWTNYARTFNKECLSCHVTGETIGWDEEVGRFETRWVDAGVACEKCHGPGARHAKAATPGTIVKPSALPADRAGAVCAQCHAGRAPLASTFSSHARFVPGMRFDEVFEPLTPVIGPGDFSGDFFVDGRPSAGSLESSALWQSACARKGGMTCLTCHTPPHGKGGLSELKMEARGDGICLGCHSGMKEPAAAARHAFHPPAAKLFCASCHMPKIVTGVLDPQADHALDVPVPENMRDFGVPDACTSCHAGKSADWAVAELEKRFPGSDRRRRRVALARALAAWRDGRPEAEALLLSILGPRDEAGILRASAATALGSVARPTPAGTAGLVAALGDADVAVAARAARSLGTRRDRSALEPLLAATRSSRDPVALSAALAALDLDVARGSERARALISRPALAGDYRLRTALALLAARAGKPEEALAHARRAIADRPDFAGARELAAAALERLGRPSEAARERERATLFRHQGSGAVSR